MTKQVLILDDDLNNRELLVFALRLGDYEIHQAQTGSECAALIEKMQFDVALLDIELPDANGLDLAKQLRQRCPDALLIMLSALDNSEELQCAKKIGANAFIVKPFNLIQVLQFIRKHETCSASELNEMEVF
jgi:two-component system NtrC family response regulator